MNTSKDLSKSVTRNLTQRQARFIVELLRGRTKREAYKRAYRPKVSSRDASIRAARISKNAAVQAALREAQEGNFGALTICGSEVDVLILEKIATDSDSPAYVRVAAAQTLLEHRRANPEPEPPRKPETIEELERFLQTQCGQQRDAAHRRNGFDELDEI